jgi:hypothetical protein
VFALKAPASAADLPDAQPGRYRDLGVRHAISQQTSDTPGLIESVSEVRDRAFRKAGCGGDPHRTLAGP